MQSNIKICFFLLSVFVFGCFVFVMLVPKSFVFSNNTNNCANHILTIYKLQQRLASYTNPTEKPGQSDPLALMAIFHRPKQKLEPNHAKRMRIVKAFEVQITERERALMYNLLHRFDTLLTRHNITYMIYAGTLLGSYRHHDLVPWDDDVDVFVNLDDRERLRTLLDTLNPQYILARSGQHDKFYSAQSFKASKYNWKWPYIDISFYRENATHLRDIATPYNMVTIFPKSITFPLHRRPLFNLSLPAPKDTFAALVWSFGLGAKCGTFGYSHMIEGGGPYGGTRDCKTLGEQFPFVEHFTLPQGYGVKEVLRFKGHNISTYLSPEPVYAVADTYSLRLKPGLKIPPNVEFPKQKSA